jgi:hypothetical protein
VLDPMSSTRLVSLAGKKRTRKRRPCLVLVCGKSSFYGLISFGLKRSLHQQNFPCQGRSVPDAPPGTFCDRMSRHRCRPALSYSPHRRTHAVLYPLPTGTAHKTHCVAPCRCSALPPGRSRPDASLAIVDAAVSSACPGRRAKLTSDKTP